MKTHSCNFAGISAESTAHGSEHLINRRDSSQKTWNSDEAVMLLGIFLLVGLVHGAQARGPHHPRGEPVVKHVHYRPTKKITQDSELLHDKEHIQEHLEEVMSEPDLAKMSDEELEFYYFQVHDSDKNSKLDGLEILHAILHTTHGDDDPETESENVYAEKSDFEYYVELIDTVFLEDDVDKDGFLSYPEYVSGRKKAIISDNKLQPIVKMV